MKIAAIVVCALMFLGCEPRFSGDRDFSLSSLNGSDRLKLVRIGGTDYLGLINTNFHSASADGSIHFYSLSDAASPQLQTSLSMRIPTGVSDFEVSSDVLVLSDRGENRLLFYDLVGGSFVQRLETNGDPKVVKLTNNPQQLKSFSRNPDNLQILAVTSQSSGIIHFIRMDTLAFISEGVQTPTNRDTVTLRNIVGANLYMVPRQLQVSGQNDRIDVSRTVSGGYGINAIELLPSVGSEQILVTSSFFDNALFGYRFENMTNSANIVWDLDRYHGGYDSGSIRFRGSKERGFRGLAVDQSGNVFASSRTDNSLYKISRSEFEREKISDPALAKGRNTRGFAQNITEFRLLTLDRDQTDEIFPKVGALVTDCPQAVGPLSVTCGGAVATRVWILGLGTKKVYRVELANVTSGDSADFVVSSALTESSVLAGMPQSILWHPTADILYVSQPDKDRVDILDADTLAVLGEIQNP